MRLNSHKESLSHGRNGEIASNRRDDQEVIAPSLHLLQICLAYINTLMIQQVLAEPVWIERMQTDDFRALTPLIWSHINPCGTFRLDLSERLELEVIAEEAAR